MKKKYRPQQELCNITDEALLLERHLILQLINTDKFQFIKGYKKNINNQFEDIKSVLTKAKKKDHDFIKNYFVLPDAIKDDLEINKRALYKCPYIYFLIKDDVKKVHAITFASILMQTNGSFFKYISPDLRLNKSISLNAVINCPNIFTNIPDKFKSDYYFVKSALNRNPYIYPHLSKAHRSLRSNLFTALKREISNNMKHFYDSIPKKFKDDQEQILEIIKLQPKMYKFLSTKQKANIKVASAALSGNYKMIKYVPKKIHFEEAIIKAFFARTYRNENIRSKIYIFKSLTRCELNFKKLIAKFIDCLSAKSLIYFVERISGEEILDVANWISLVEKNPGTFQYLDCGQDNYMAYYSVLETAILRDYKNFKHINFRYYDVDQFKSEMYAEFLALAIRVYEDCGKRGAHPASYLYLNPDILSIKQLKKVVTHIVDGKIETDFVNIFKYGNNRIRRNKYIYVKALNVDASLARLFPITKRSSKKIFKGLNSKAKNALFKKWLRIINVKDVLEAAALKQEIFTLYAK